MVYDAALAPAMVAGVTLMVMTAVEVGHVPLTVLKVYVVVTVGEATGLAQFVQLNPVAGPHEYVPPPVPVRFVEVPEQITVPVEVTLAGTEVVTVTVTTAVAVGHDPLETVTVYVVVTVGDAVGD